ncbi:MAG TPA: DUF6599 family protein [bacterium]|nr:DUF6599 family protein [bacterium]
MKKRFFIAFLCFFCSTLGGTLLTFAFGSESRPFTFPEVKGWKQSGEIQTFSPENLYEYINGAADLYLAYDFEELKVAEYQNEEKAAVTVEVYRQRAPYEAFGIYSQERLPAAEVLAIGAQGYTEGDYLNFFTGPYYVKISLYQAGPDGREVLTSFAKKVAEKLGEKGQLPSILKSLPVEGKARNSEKFIAKKFLGYSFLHSAFTADYLVAGMRFQVFMIESGSKDESIDMIGRYLRQNGKPSNGIVEGRVTLSDPHHGVVEISWREGRIWGILNLDDPALRTKYLRLIEEGLKERKE